jgi:hypothetical protein
VGMPRLFFIAEGQRNTPTFTALRLAKRRGPQ